MGLLSKIKSALFEEEQEEPELAKKIDVEKSIEEDKIPIKHYEEDISTFEHSREEKRTTPIIFDVEDFIEEPKEPVYEQPKHESKILYGGYEIKQEKEKIKEEEKFIPSPVISPVYGILDKNYTPEKHKKVERKSLDSLFVEERKDKLDLESIRRKAFGDIVEEKEEPREEEIEEEDSILYEMQNINDKPGIEKISLGDAEEYFEDLGLEYDVDYTDLAKEKMTRSKKNKELTKEVNEEIQEDEIEQEQISTIEDAPEEKNLYDLIDMMYDNKE